MSRLNQYIRFKDQVQNSERRLSEDRGAYEQALKQLKGESLPSLEDAVEELKKVAKDATKAAKDFDKALKKFKKKWKGKINESL